MPFAGWDFGFIFLVTLLGFIGRGGKIVDFLLKCLDFLSKCFDFVLQMFGFCIGNVGLCSRLRRPLRDPELDCQADVNCKMMNFSIEKRCKMISDRFLVEQ